MFVLRRPSSARIDRFVGESQHLPLSYGPIGIVTSGTADRQLDEATITIGKGRADFERAKHALQSWAQFKLGWVDVFPVQAPVEVGSVVAVVIRHLGFWSVNGCRIVFVVNEDRRFGFAYGSLTNHAESGEELFDVSLDPGSDDVTYTIRATSKPQAVLARIGQPIARALQARFRRDSTAAMMRAVAIARTPR